MNKGYITAGEAGLIVFIAGSVIWAALIMAACFAEEYYYSQKADAQPEKAPDNQIRYVLQDRNGRELMTCTGGPEAIRVCLEASRLLEEKEKIKPNN